MAVSMTAGEWRERKSRAHEKAIIDSGNPASATVKFARATVDGAVAQQEEIAPEFPSVVENAVDRAAPLADKGDYVGYVCPVFLLARRTAKFALTRSCYALHRFRATCWILSAAAS